MRCEEPPCGRNGPPLVRSVHDRRVEALLLDPREAEPERCDARCALDPGCADGNIGSG